MGLTVHPLTRCWRWRERLNRPPLTSDPWHALAQDSLDVVNVWEADEPKPCLTVEEALANAPDREGNFFKVPPGGSS